MPAFYVKNEQLINFTLALQKINDIAMPIAVQNTLNAVSRDVKKRTLKISTEKEFKIDKKAFFKANSGFETHNAKEFNYNINRLKAEVGITKGIRAKETATEQVAHQQQAINIKRSVNPLGNKPQTKTAHIDLLSKKPEIYDSSQSYPEGNSIAYIRRAQRAHRRKAGFLIKNSKKGAVNRVISIRSRKPTKRDPRRMLVNIKPIASYVSQGKLDLKKKHPFLDNAVKQSAKETIEKTFIKEAEKQIQRAVNRR